MRRHHNARGRFELAGQFTPIHSPALVDLLGRVPGAPPELPTAPSPRRPVAGRELHATRGATDGATGGGHAASGVTPREVPVGAVDRVAALARECTVRGSANADDAPRRPPARWPVMFGDVRVVDGGGRVRSKLTSLGVRRMVMTRHDDSQRIDGLAVTQRGGSRLTRIWAVLYTRPRMGTDSIQPSRRLPTTDYRLPT